MLKSFMSSSIPPEVIHRRGLMMVLSSPSGAGKTTLSRRLLEADQELSLSISVTTPRLPVEKTLSQGRDVLFDIDWQGTQQLAEKARDDLVSIFILPPSWRELERRLFTRAQDDPAEINRRMAEASDEMSHWAEYDYVIVNRDLDQTVEAVRSILLSERLKRRRQIGLAEFISGLKAGH
jgi:guanylate kinase